jgi:hypothetical protein
MPKAKLVTRSESTSSVTADNIPKNSGLTNAELDSNFLNLRDQGWRIRADDSTQHTITADTQVNFEGGTITTDANGDITVSNLGGSTLGNITGSGDTLSSSGSLININDPLSISIAGSSGSSVGNIARFNSGGNAIDFNHQGQLAGSFFIYDTRAQQAGIDYPFEVSFSSTNTVKINGMKFPSDDGSAGQFLTTDGNNFLSWTSTLPNPSTIGEIKIEGDTISNINSTGEIILSPGATSNRLNLDGVEWHGDGTRQVFYNGASGTKAWQFIIDSPLALEVSNKLIIGPLDDSSDLGAREITTKQGRALHISSKDGYGIGNWARIELDGGTISIKDGTLDVLTNVIKFSNLPTSDPTVANQLWNDSGTLKVSAG